MRPVLHGDVAAAARVLQKTPHEAREAMLAGLWRQARAADIYRKRHGRAHGGWGNGSLMAAALAAGAGVEPPLTDRDYCACLAMVYARLARAGGG